MEMTVKDEWKLVEIWLTNAEKSDPVLRAGLQSVYDTYKKKKYLVAVSRWGVQTAKGISCWAKLSNTQHRKPSKLPS